MSLVKWALLGRCPDFMYAFDLIELDGDDLRRVNRSGDGAQLVRLERS